MLSLSPPYPVIDGYALFPDHADPGLWYAMPRAPRLAQRDGVPQFSLTQYLGGGAGSAKVSGGILSLGTELLVDEATLADLASKLSARQGPQSSGSVRVTPVLFDAGSVELVVLGKTSSQPSTPTPGQPSGPDGATSAAPGGTFSVDFLGTGKPSLGTVNESVFQLVLNEAAAEMMAACLEEPELPVIVTYVMTYAALRPAFTIDIHADWQKIYHSLESKLTANAWFVAADVENTISRTLEESGIDVNVVVEGTGDTAASEAEKTKQQLLDWVLEKLFVPMVPPDATATTIGNVIDDVVWSLQRAIIPGASYRLRQMDETQLRTMDIRARERIAEAREFRPQGMLGALISTLRVDKDGKELPTWPATKAHLLQSVELSGFPRLEVGIDLVDRFASDGVRAARVALARHLPDGSTADAKEFAFTAAGQHNDYVVALLDDAARAAIWDVPYRYQVAVDFDPSSLLKPPGNAVSPWRDGRASQLLVDPREAYAVTDVTVTVAPLFSFALFPAVTVELHAGEQPGSTATTSMIQLTPETPLQHWLFASAPEDVTYSWRATYHRTLEAGGDVTTDWSAMVEPWLSLPDPMPEKLQVTFFIDLPWPQIATALLQLRYDDPDHDVHYAEETIVLGAGTPSLSRTYSIAPGGSRALQYRLTLQPTSGGLVDGSWREADDDRIIIDRRLIDEREVRVRLVGGTLADAKLAQVKLHLEVRDPADQHVRSSADVSIAPGQEQGFTAAFRYLLGDPPVRTVFWQLTTVDVNGFVGVGAWGSGSSDVIVVNAAARTVTG